MITFLIGFIVGYIGYPTYKSIKLMVLMHKINTTMAVIKKEHDEIRQMFNEIDKEWNGKND